MAKKLKTILTFVQDETGSMLGKMDTTIDAFNEYFNTLKKQEGIGDVDATIWQFSDTTMGGMDGEDRVRLLFKGALKKVPVLKPNKNYRPRGMTPLLDAVGTAIRDAEKKDCDRHLFIIQTDGLENHSKEFTREQIVKLVKRKEKAKKWTLVFLGVSIDNWTKEAQALGAMASSSVPFVVRDTQLAYASLATATGNLLRTNSVKGTVAADTVALMNENETGLSEDDPMIEDIKRHLAKSETL